MELKERMELEKRKRNEIEYDEIILACKT